MTNALRSGDLVRLSKKSIHDMKATDWTDVKAKYSPRFKIDKTITLASLTSVNLTKHSLYKIQFAFFDKFPTTWITVANGNGTFLNHIEFTFLYSNDKIVDVKYILDYNDEEEHHGVKPEHFYLIYKWQQIKDKDITMGLFVLFFTGIALSGFIFTYNAMRFQFEFGSSSKKRKQQQQLPTTFNQGYQSNNSWKTMSPASSSPSLSSTTATSNVYNNNNNNTEQVVHSDGNQSPGLNIRSSISGDHFGFETVSLAEVESPPHQLHHRQHDSPPAAGTSQPYTNTSNKDD
ncbi:hypothetical protein SAMD00019534_064030 [Acytostelium subglobosum LB1]|uniref:hypothetical protein n=1 Tax=Acytostelium subglobosum LB1 TaxID=1410327 RepID=UPI000644C5E9|nr:hypothetical protein SAMD00019534_064030 [Acytostelium subglobosum LB1]GAM23228.1 hypothetical protein SAMD00019534_064030 [Acytostelium subglobosum LB1]|eukprot:XP_012753677.1 hypothetical protein SAMD00019534_064030 [Acytostelium subglobosum LB1]